MPFQKHNNMHQIKILILKVIYFLNFIIGIPKFYYHLYFNKTVLQQLNNLNDIPVIVINYNQLFYLKKNIDQLIKNNFNNIIVIDNNSTFPELLEYYKTLSEYITVIRLKENLGHLVLYKKLDLFKKYCKGFYFLTDADIILNDHLPLDFKKTMVNALKKYHYFHTKVGFALDISDIPDLYPLKQKVMKWESKYWEKPIGENFYEADIDTTFALYKPEYFIHRFSDFTKAIRIAGNFTAKHGGWYLDPANLSEEHKLYFQNNISTSWIFNNEGKLDDRTTNSTY